MPETESPLPIVSAKLLNTGGAATSVGLSVEVHIRTENLLEAVALVHAITTTLTEKFGREAYAATLAQYHETLVGMNFVPHTVN